MLPVPLSPVNVSVVEQPRLINRQYKYARLTSTFNDAQGMNVRVMLDSRSKAPARRGKPHRISSNACTTGLLAAATQLCDEGIAPNPSFATLNPGCLELVSVLPFFIPQPKTPTERWTSCSFAPMISIYSHKRWSHFLTRRDSVATPAGRS